MPTTINEMTSDTISVSLNRETIEINEEIYTALFENSVVHGLAKYQYTLETKSISFGDLVYLARKAQIPYALFFAPRRFVLVSISRKQNLLLRGVGKDTFSLSSRGSVELRDVELIVKDFLLKQALLKRHHRYPDNPVFESLRRSRLSIVEQASHLRNLVDIDLMELSRLGKADAFEYICNQIEGKRVFIAQSSRLYMPQIIQPTARFSGMCIKDKKVPFIFLNNKDEFDSYEPEGRKILTLALLLVCLAKGKFKPVSYNEQARDLIGAKEFLLAEELLMPKKSFRGVKVRSLDDAKSLSDIYCVTPSALLMRLLRLEKLSKRKATEYKSVLEDEYKSRERPRGGAVDPLKGFRKYTGVEYPRAIFELVDSGSLPKTDARRILLFNKRGSSFLDRFRGFLQV